IAPPRSVPERALRSDRNSTGIGERREGYPKLPTAPRRGRLGPSGSLSYLISPNNSGFEKRTSCLAPPCFGSGPMYKPGLGQSRSMPSWTAPRVVRRLASRGPLQDNQGQVVALKRSPAEVEDVAHHPVQDHGGISGGVSQQALLQSPAAE